MVVFTCIKCGNSLKKKEVEYHKCRPFHLTCVDCLKDFGADYVKHLGCVSEKDRYGAAGLNGIPVKKTKMQRWLEAAHDCCSKAIDNGTPGLTDSIRDLLTYLLQLPNIPIQAKKFDNMLYSARPREHPENIKFVWNLLGKAHTDLHEEMKAEREAAEAEAKKKKAEMKKEKQESSDSSSSDSEDDSESKVPMNGMNKVPSQDVQSKSEKKKKRMMSESESVINGTSETRKVKKSKKNPKTEECEDSSNLNNALDACHLNGVVEENLSKKEKKERKKREKYEAELKTLESVKSTNETEPQDKPMDEVVEETETKKSKKKKKAELKNSVSVEDEPMEEPREEVVEDTETKKGKKKKNKKTAEEIVPVDEEPSDTKDKKKEKKSKKQQRQDEAERIYAEKPNKKGKTDKLENGKLNDTLKLDENNGAEFSWDTAILQVLESQSDHEVSLKKLSKKVVNEYLLSVGDDAYVDEAKIINKFHKKLQKMHNVLVHKDKVRLKTSRD